MQDFILFLTLVISVVSQLFSNHWNHLEITLFCNRSGFYSNFEHVYYTAQKDRTQPCHSLIQSQRNSTEYTIPWPANSFILTDVLVAKYVFCLSMKSLRRLHCSLSCVTGPPQSGGLGPILVSPIGLLLPAVCGDQPSIPWICKLQCNAFNN